MAMGLATGLVWFAVVFLIHLVVLWTTSPIRRARIAQMVFLFGLVGLLSSLAAFFNNSSFVSGALAFSALAAILVYGGLLMLYLPFYYSVAASLSLQTLILLSKQANGSLPVTALQYRFASRQLVAQRLATMGANRFLIERDRTYYLTDKGRRTARIFLFFKTLWRLGAGG